MWKSVHIENYPIKIVHLECQPDVMNTRARSSGQLIESRVTSRSEKTFTNDAIHIWNQAPRAIKNCTSLYSARKSIKTFVASLPT